MCTAGFLGIVGLRVLGAGTGFRGGVALRDGDDDGEPSSSLGRGGNGRCEKCVLGRGNAGLPSSASCKKIYQHIRV